MTMESSTLSQNINTLTVDDVDEIRPNEDGPFPDASIVIFDVDTTDGKTPNSEICQIAAWCKDNSFREFMLPDGGFNPICSDINGFTRRNKKLLHYKKEVNSVSPKEGLEKFLDFLSNITGNTRNILLAANNCDSFHRYVIVRNLKYYNLFDRFKSLVLGFINTMSVFKSKLSDREKEFGVEKLANDYLDKSSFPEHKHAAVIVEMLVSLIKVLKCDDAMMKQHVNELDEFIPIFDLKVEFEKTLKDDQLKKIVEAGITTNMLKDAYKKDSDNGVASLLQGGDGKAGINVNKATIKKITDQVAKLCAKN